MQKTNHVFVKKQKFNNTTTTIHANNQSRVQRMYKQNHLFAKKLTTLKSQQASHIKINKSKEVSSNNNNLSNNKLQ